MLPCKPWRRRDPLRPRARAPHHPRARPDPHAPAHPAPVPGDEGARAEQVVLAPAGDHVAKVDHPGEPPSPVPLGEQEVLRDPLPRQDHGRRVERQDQGRLRQQLIEVGQQMWRQPLPGVPRLAALDLPCDEVAPGRPARRKRAGRHRLHLRDRPADLPEDTLLIGLAQGRPGLRPQDAVQPRHDQVRPTVALALCDEFGGRHGERVLQEAECRSLGHEKAAVERREELQDQPTVEVHHEVRARLIGGEEGGRNALSPRQVPDQRAPEVGAGAPPREVLRAVDGGEANHGSYADSREAQVCLASGRAPSRTKRWSDQKSREAHTSRGGPDRLRGPHERLEARETCRAEQHRPAPWVARGPAP